MINFKLFIQSVLVLTTLCLHQIDALSQRDIKGNLTSWQNVVSTVEAEESVKIYYDSTVYLDLVIDDARLDLDALIRLLQGTSYVLLPYTAQQWVLLPRSEANLTVEKWQKRKAIEETAAKKQALASTVVIGDRSDLVVEGLVSLSGVVTEASTGEPIFGATITSSSSSIGAVTDVDGRYSIDLPAGECLIEIQSVGLAPFTEEILIYSSGEYDVQLINDAIRLEEVVISGKADDANLRSVAMGVEEISIKDLQKLPSFMGEIDVLKSLLSLPGVSTAGEGVGGFNVRGGNADQNLIMQDDIIFFNPTHALGFFNLFHSDLVEDIKLYKGHIPAKYGGRISSVLNSTSRVGSKEKWGLNAGLGLTSSKLAIEGPLIADRMSISIGGRISTANWLLQRVQVPDVQQSKVNFHDIQGKLTYWLNDNSTIGFQAYNANDDFRLVDDLQFDYQTNAISAYYNTIIGDNKTLNVRVTSSEYESDLNDLLPSNATRFNTGVDYLSAKVDYSIQSDQGNFYNLGGEVINYNIQPGSIYPGDELSQIEEEVLDTDDGIEAALYINSEIEVTERLKVLAGFRLSAFGLSGPREIREYQSDAYFDEDQLVGSSTQSGLFIDNSIGWEPRIAANYELTSSSNLKLGLNRTYQYMHQISNTVAATPIDFWKLADNNVQRQVANSVSLGWFKNLKNNAYAFSIEGYFRTIDNALWYKDFADLIANERIETELLVGVGRHYGLEMSIEKSVGEFTTKIGYGFTRSLLKMDFDDPSYSVNDGEWFASNFDKPHNFNVQINYNPSMRVSFNVNFSYSTGRPISAPIGKFDDWNVLGVSVFDQVNNFRIPDYHRLDFSMNIFPGYKKDKKFKGSWSLSLYNVYARKNPYSVYFEQESVNRLRAYKLAVLGTAFPAITYNLRLE